MDTYEALKTRRSIRRFKQEKIDKKLLMDCLNAGRLAPTGMNCQPLEYILITENLDKIYPHTSWAGYLRPKGWKQKEDERPTAYIAILVDTENNEYAKHDVGLAAANIVNTAHAKGIGNCILGAIKDKGELLEFLRIPAKYELSLLIAFGYPAHKSIVEEYEGDVKYREDEDGNFHVPKKSLESIVHKQKFKK